MKQLILLCFSALVCAFSVGVSAAEIEVQDGPTHMELAPNAGLVRKQLEMVVDDSGMYKQEKDINPDVEKLDPPQRSMIPRPEERQIHPVINSITDRGSQSMVQPEYEKRGHTNEMALVNNRGPDNDQRHQSPGFIPSEYGPPGSNKPRYTPDGPNHWPENWKRHCKKHRHHRHHHHHHHHEDANEGEDKEEESPIFSKNCVPQNKVVIISDEVEYNKKRMGNECKETCISRPNRDIFDILNTDLNVNDSIVIIAGISSYPHNISSILNRINDFVQISTKANIFISTIPIKEDESDDLVKNYIKGVNELTRNTLKQYPSIRLLDLEAIHRDLMKFSPKDWGKSQICTWINDIVKPRTSVNGVYTQSTTTEKVSVLSINNQYNAAGEKLGLSQRVPVTNEDPFDISIIFSMGSLFDEDINKLTNGQSWPLMTSNYSSEISNHKTDFNLSPYSKNNPWFHNRDDKKNPETDNSSPHGQASETVRYEDADGTVVSDDSGNTGLDTNAVIMPSENNIEVYDDGFKLITDTTELIDGPECATENQLGAQLMKEEQVVDVEKSPEVVIFDV